jgi:ribosomal protein L11 methyltransferase
MNNWWEIEINCDRALEDSIYWRLEQFGCTGAAVEIKENNCCIRAYLPKIDDREPNWAELGILIRENASLIDLAPPDIKWHLIDEEDWATSWKQYWHPTNIGQNFLILPAWLPPPENNDRTIIKLDPGMAFGTGMHQTTQLCIEGLEGLKSGEITKGAIADIGCGSGILSIAALMLGIEKVYAVDIDVLAVISTKANIELNQIEPNSLIVAEGSTEKLRELHPEGFTGFLCNILAHVIIKLLPDITASAKPNAWGIFSGLLIEQTPSVIEHLEKNGWKIEKTSHKDQWASIIAVFRD